MLVAGCEPQLHHPQQHHQDYLPVVREVIVRPPPPPQPQLEFALEGRSILLQRREPPLAAGSTPGSNPGAAAYAQSRPRSQYGKAGAANAKTAGTFSPLQLRIDLHSEQGVDVSTASSDALSPDAKAGLSRRQRAQQRRRQEQQKPADEVVYQRRTRPKTPAAPPRTPLAMSTMSMPAAGQKFVTDDSVCFNSAEEASAAVKRLLAKTGSSLAEERHVHHVTKKVSETFISDSDYLQDSFDFLHQRHVKNLSDVISRHQQRQQQAPLGTLGQAASQEQQSKNSRKQVHIHQSSFYDGQNGHLAEMSADAKTFKSTKSISLSNNNSSSNSCDLDDAKDLQMQQHRRCERENSTSSVQSSNSSVRSGSSDNCNNNFCDTVSVNNKSNTKISSKSSTSSTTSSSTTTRMQQSFSTKKQVIKQSFSSSSQDFEDRIGIDVTLTPSSPGAAALISGPIMDLASANTFGSSTGTSKVTSKVSSSSSVCSASSDRPEECKQSVKTFKSKTVKKTVSDGKQVHTDVDNFSETAEEEAEGSPDKPVITFSHVSSEGSHQAFTDNIVRFDSSTLSSPSRSRSPSPLLEMPAPYSDLSKEIKRPPMEKA